MIKPLVLLWVALPVTAVAWWLTRGGSVPMSTVDAYLVNAPFSRQPASWAAGNINIDGAGRLANARVIVQEFTAAGFSPLLALAAVANANAESSLDHRAIGDGGKSVGLFQLHESGGGRGMSVADRQNPVLNARRMVAETRAAWRATWGGYRSLADAVAGAATAAELAGLFAVHVERPADRDKAYQMRSASMATLFPGINDAKG